MKLIKAAAAVLNQTPLDWDGNRRNIQAALQAAREQGATIVCLPELCITGYGCDDAFYSPGVRQTAQEVLLELLPETRGMIVSLGLPMMHSGGIFNMACLAADGQLLGFVGKQHLAGEGIHYEPRWFKPWPAEVRAVVHVDGRTYPIGDLIFECGGVRIGFEICEDAWVGTRPGAHLARRGVDVILNPSASHFAFGKHEIRKRFVLEGSRAYHVSYVYANLLGNEAGRAIYEGDAMIAASGHMLATGPRFSFADWRLTTAVLDIDQTRMRRAQIGSFVPQILRHLDDDLVSCPFPFPQRRAEPMNLRGPDWESGTAVKFEEFTRAVSLALFDYMRKSRAKGFVVSLSGGADSTSVAVLCAMLVKLGIQELGPQRFWEKLPVGNPPAGEIRVDQLVGRLLTCVYQATVNSSPETRDAATAVAQSLGARYYVFDVQSIVEEYVAMVSQALQRELTWESDDVPLQNIQARVRAPGAWMLANLQGALLLATSNRSEAAVGYATMDGDTSGGLSPIAGIDKAFLRRWLRWMQTEGPEGIGPQPALEAVTRLPPTAELRPLDSRQTDEDDLMPYDLLDAIERAAIRDKLQPVEVLQRILADGWPYTLEQLAQWTERFFRLWSRNQWKRERYAPSFHLDDENLDPKTWCRFPILSGGFEREIRAMHEFVAAEDTSATPAERA